MGNIIHEEHTAILLKTEQGHASFYAIMPPDGQCRQQGFAAVTHTAEHVMAASWLVVVCALVLTSEWIKFGRKITIFKELMETGHCGICLCFV